MRAAWTVGRSRLVRQLAGSLALVLLLGLAGGAALAAASGARRTGTAVDRFLEWSRAPHLYVVGAEEHLDAIERLPQVAAARRDSFTMWQVVAPDGTWHRGRVLNVLADAGRPAAPSGSRERVVEGRLADQADPSEITVDESAADHLDLKLGNTLTLRGFTPDEGERFFRGDRVEPTGPLATVRVVGVTRGPLDLTVNESLVDVLYRSSDDVRITEALFWAHRGQVADHGVVTALHLRDDGAERAQVAAAVMDLAGSDAIVADDVQERSVAREAKGATDLESLALWGLSGLIAVATIAIVGQSLARQVALDADQAPALRALGMSPREVAAAVSLRSAVAIFAGAAAAAVVAVAASPLTPIGMARKAEIDSGIQLDATVLAMGVPLLIVVLLLRIAVTAARLTTIRHPQRDLPGSAMRTAERLASWGLPVTTVTGVAFALDRGTGRTRVPVRASLAGAVFAILAVSAAAVFGANLDRLVTRPALQGWRWDVALGNPHGEDLREAGTAAIRRAPDVQDITAIGMVETRVADFPVSLLAVDLIAGPLPVPVVEGRAPARNDEVALGGRLLEKAGAGVGDEVVVGDQRFRVVGRAVVSPLIVNDAIDLGGGGLLTVEGAARLEDEVVLNQFLVSLKEGADRDAALAQLRADFPGTVLTSHPPADVVNLARIRRLPPGLAALLAVLAIVTIGHTLTTSVRRRRQELAILKTLGFASWQLVRTVIWQASTLVGLALAVGLPVGVILGRQGWKVLVGAMALPVDPTLPILGLAVMVPIAFVAANLAAAGPAAAAARTRASEILSVE